MYMPGHKVNVFHTVGHSKKKKILKATVLYVLGGPIQPSFEVKAFWRKWCFSISEEWIAITQWGRDREDECSKFCNSICKGPVLGQVMGVRAWRESGERCGAGARHCTASEALVRSLVFIRREAGNHWRLLSRGMAYFAASKWSLLSQCVEQNNNKRT